MFNGLAVDKGGQAAGDFCGFNGHFLDGLGHGQSIRVLLEPAGQQRPIALHHRDNVIEVMGHNLGHAAGGGDAVVEASVIAGREC